jgi:hypothetical protein
MPTPPPDRSRRSLGYGQRMFLLYGPADRWDDAFADEGEVREAWKAHRAHILSHYQHGRRPMAWWRFEAPFPYPGYDKECAALFEAGLLGEEEREQLVAQWFVHFTRPQDPRFTYCVGFAKPSDRVATWLKGKAARRAYYRWAGIPRDLLKRWTRERRQRKRRIQELKAATARCPVPAA